MHYTLMFSDNDFYHLDDISGLTKTDLCDPTGPFKMSMGKADYLLKQVNHEIKRVDKANKKKR